MGVESINYLPDYRCDYIVPDRRVEATTKRVNSELEIQQTELKVKFLQDTLAGKDLTKPERIALEYMLRDAQADFALLKQKANVH